MTEVRWQRAENRGQTRDYCAPRVKLPEMTNVECRLTNGGFASLSRFK
ncbi:hypothetical protein D1AOALGA4SA_2797 [Olavius algarvensis Delta 1 endosymbiont]|nr:hypothetical protein D1AOALGA4SA_2797 [Olavius algarvensis Delta 1 endosymbiont]